MTDAGPLAGRRVAVRDDDPALRHAGRLCRWLGAQVESEPAEGIAFAVPAAAGPVTAHADWAQSGAMALTGRADGPPLLAPGAPASALRGALHVLSALTSQQYPGVELLGERAAVAGFTRQGPRSVGSSYLPVATVDGWAGLSLARDADFGLVPALVEREVRGDPWCAVRQWAAGRSAEHVASRAQLLGLAGVRIPAPSEARGEPHPFAFTRGESRPRRQPPVVVDLTALWAGPLCAHLLGLAGARVIKVESVRRPDGARGGPAAFFDLLHAGHECVALDLSDERGRAALAVLIGRADVVLESSRPRALRQLGIVAEDVVAGGTTWMSITAYGRSGPGANHVGYGDDAAAAAGLAAYDDGMPMPCGDAIADPLAGVHAAVATAAALRADRAYLIELSMRDVAAATLDLDGAPPEQVVPAAPRARRPLRRAAGLGADTDVVLREFGIAQ